MCRENPRREAPRGPGSGWSAHPAWEKDPARSRTPQKRLESTGDEQIADQLNESPAGPGWGTCAWLHCSGFPPACGPASTSRVIRWGDKSTNPPGQCMSAPGTHQVHGKGVGKRFPVPSTPLSIWSHLSRTDQVTDTKYVCILPL